MLSIGRCVVGSTSAVENFQVSAAILRSMSRWCAVNGTVSLEWAVVAVDAVAVPAAVSAKAAAAVTARRGRGVRMLCSFRMGVGRGPVPDLDRPLAASAKGRAVVAGRLPGQACA